MAANVFVSHRGVDSALAERLGQDLGDAGHTVRLDVWELGVGDSIVQWMQDGLAGSRYVVLCYSAQDVLSPWIAREWQSTLARQLDGHLVRILPVKLSGGEPPAILYDIKWADLTADWDQGVAELLRAIR